MNVSQYPYARNWLFFLQRATGLFTFVFVLVHLWQYRVAKALGTLPWHDFYRQLTVHLNERGLDSFYVLGSCLHGVSLRERPLHRGTNVGTLGQRA